MPPHLIIAACVTAVVAVGAATVSASELPGAQRTATLADVKRATAKYQDESRARRDGYAPASPCIALPGTGGMGIHYINAQLAGDDEVDPQRPEMLLYEPQSNGRLRLVGVEWFMADADQDPTTDDDRPSLLGQDFDGPMPGHGPGMPVHYDLHAYPWRHNPEGTFAALNPKVSCP